MTTRITLIHEGAELVVTGDYFTSHPSVYRKNGALLVAGLPSEFQIDRIEQSGADVTEHYRQMRLIPVIEEMAREVVESD